MELAREENNMVGLANIVLNDSFAIGFETNQDWPRAEVAIVGDKNREETK